MSELLKLLKNQHGVLYIQQFKLDLQWIKSLDEQPLNLCIFATKEMKSLYNENFALLTYENDIKKILDQTKPTLFVFLEPDDILQDIFTTDRHIIMEDKKLIMEVLNNEENKIIVITSTIIKDSLFDFSFLINLVAGKVVIPETIETFTDKFKKISHIKQYLPLAQSFTNITQYILSLLLLSKVYNYSVSLLTSYSKEYASRTVHNALHDNILNPSCENALMIAQLRYPTIFAKRCNHGFLDPIPEENEYDFPDILNMITDIYHECFQIQPTNDKFLNDKEFASDTFWSIHRLRKFLRFFQLKLIPAIVRNNTITKVPIWNQKGKGHLLHLNGLYSDAVYRDLMLFVTEIQKTYQFDVTQEPLFRIIDEKWDSLLSFVGDVISVFDLALPDPQCSIATAHYKCDKQHALLSLITLGELSGLLKIQHPELLNRSKLTYIIQHDINGKVPFSHVLPKVFQTTIQEAMTPGFKLNHIALSFRKMLGQTLTEEEQKQTNNIPIIKVDSSGYTWIKTTILFGIQFIQVLEKVIQMLNKLPINTVLLIVFTLFKFLFQSLQELNAAVSLDMNVFLKTVKNYVSITNPYTFDKQLRDIQPIIVTPSYIPLSLYQMVLLRKFLLRTLTPMEQNLVLQTCEEMKENTVEHNLLFSDDMYVTYGRFVSNISKGVQFDKYDAIINATVESSIICIFSTFPKALQMFYSYVTEYKQQSCMYFSEYKKNPNENIRFLLFHIKDVNSTVKIPNASILYMLEPCLHVSTLQKLQNMMYSIHSEPTPRYIKCQVYTFANLFIDSLSKFQTWNVTKLLGMQKASLSTFESISPDVIAWEQLQKANNEFHLFSLGIQVASTNL